MSMKRICETFIVVACVTSPLSSAADMPSVSELLDRYTSNQARLAPQEAYSKWLNSI